PCGIPVRLIAGDVNGDGRQDLVAATSGASGQVLVYRQRPDGTFGAPDYQVEMGCTPSDLALVDLDGTGRPDVAVTDEYSGDVRILQNSLAGTFSSQLRFAAGTGLFSLEGWESDDLHSLAGPVAIAVGDFTAGLPSLIVANSGADNFSLLRNDGL